MTMPEIGVAIGGEQAKPWIKDEEFIARGKVYVVADNDDAAQPAVSAPARPVDTARVPVENLLGFTPLDVDKIKAAMTIALLRTAHDRADQQSGKARHLLQRIVKDEVDAIGAAVGDGVIVEV